MLRAKLYSELFERGSTWDCAFLEHLSMIINPNIMKKWKKIGYKKQLVSPSHSVARAGVLIFIIVCKINSSLLGREKFKFCKK